ncbi:substrate-binding periplasmic protein [Oxalobacteraceae bacterium A2-2]
MRLATFDYPPYMLSGAAAAAGPGPVVDTVREAFRRAGIAAEITVYPFQRALRLVELGQADGIFTLKVTPQRAAHFIFSKEPLLYQEYVLYAASNSSLSFNGDLAKLGPVLIGVVESNSYGSRFDAYAKTLPAAYKDISNSHEANFRKLIAGRVQLIVCSRAAGDSIVRRMGASANVKVIGPPIESVSSHIMFNPASVAPATVAAFDRQLHAMRQDGTVQRIFARYLD